MYFCKLFVIRRGIMAKKQLKGTVVSDQMQKTVVVRVPSTVSHPRYKKTYKVHKKYKAHDENEEYQMGDQVLIEECRPLSKQKRWRVVKQVTDDR